LISTSKNNDGLVIAYCEWRNVGQSGFDKLHGEYVYIADIWIHDSHHNDWSIYREFMNEIFQKALHAKFMYFQRRKYQGRMSRVYTKERIMKLVDKCPMMLVKVLV